MDESRFQAIRIAGFAASLALVYGLQLLAPYRGRRLVSTPSWRQNLPLAILNSALLALVCGACVCTATRAAEVRGWGLLRALAAPPWLAAVATLVVLDAALWVWHRANHGLGWLWRFHRVHHSDVDFDLTTALRFHTGELLLSLPLKVGVVLALGASIPGVLAFEVVFGLFNVLIHGSVGLPAAWEARMSALFVVPTAHRRHHSIETGRRAANFGTVFSLWDRAVGTWRGGDAATPIATGVPDLAGRPGLARCLVLPFTRDAGDASTG